METGRCNAPAHKLFDLVHVRHNGNGDKPARAFSDYEVIIEKEKVPKEVELIELV